MTRLLLFLLVMFYTNCTCKSRQNQLANRAHTDSTQTILRTDIHEIRLGESNYFILLPDKFTISEFQGKEGGLGYDIIPKDTASTMFGVIVLEPGNPIGEDSSDRGFPKEIVSSHFLDGQIKWKIYVTKTAYYNATTDEKGNLSAYASSKKRNEIDSLVSIISTLKQK